VKMPLFLRATLARAYPRVIGLVREPTWVAQETLLPAMSVAAFAFVYRSLGAEEYVAFVVVGGAMMAFWLNVLWAMGIQFYWERETGNLELYIAAPAPMMSILAGMALGGMFMTSVRAAVILATGIVFFGVRFHPSSWWALAGVFLLTLTALYGLGMVFASVFLLWGRRAWHLVNLLQEPVYLLSGLNYPVRTLPTVLLGVATLLPLTIGVDALRQILFSDAAAGLFGLGTEVAMLAAFAGGFLTLARWSLAHMERLGREQGTLSERGQ
jgi:ABC-2 type transport system permease protein